MSKFSVVNDDMENKDYRVRSTTPPMLTHIHVRDINNSNDTSPSSLLCIFVRDHILSYISHGVLCMFIHEIVKPSSFRRTDILVGRYLYDFTELRVFPS